MKKKILFLYSGYTTFVANDEIILKERYEVKKYQFAQSKIFYKMIWELVKQVFFLLRYIWKVDIVYSWFSDFYTFLPFLFAKILGKKTIVVVGGFDAVSIPEIKYGLFYKRDIRQLLGVLSYKLSDYILPVDQSLVKSINYYFHSEGRPTGIRNYVPNLKAKIIVIPTDFDFDLWKPINVPREKSVITFAYAPNMQKFVGKGFDLLIEVAKKLPEVTFSLIGIEKQMKNHAKSIAPKNVILYGSQSGEKIRKELSKHKVYALLSMSEGMPNSLCEAMLCGCIPVGSNVGGIKDIIGDCGFILYHKSIDEAVQLIKKALDCDEEYATCGRSRIISKFPKGLRQSKLYKILG